MSLKEILPNNNHEIGYIQANFEAMTGVVSDIRYVVIDWIFDLRDRALSSRPDFKFLPSKIGIWPRSKHD